MSDNKPIDADELHEMLRANAEWRRDEGLDCSELVFIGLGTDKRLCYCLYGLVGDELIVGPLKPIIPELACLLDLGTS